MKINRDSKRHNYLNDLGVVVSSTGNKGVGDSLGRTATAALIYDEDRKDILKGLDGFFKVAHTSPEAGTQVYVVRYPVGIENAVQGNSRDHVVKWASCMKQMGEEEMVKWFLRYKAKRPSINLAYTPSQKLWFKALFSKFWSIVYMMYKLPGLAVIYPVWNWTLRKISGTLETYDTPSECKSMIALDPPAEWKKWLVNRQVIVPTFAFFYTLYEINALESKFARRVLQVVMRLHFEKSNYVARAMCGQEVECPEGYLPSRKNRWSIRLDRTCNRDMTVYDDTEEDNIELGMLKYYCNGVSQEYSRSYKK